MHSGSVTLPEVIEAFKILNGKAKSRDIEDIIIKSRGGILPETYRKGGWNSYRKTINQVMQTRCPGYAKYKGEEYFERLGPGYFRLIGFSKERNDSIVESRQYESHGCAQKTKITEYEFEKILEENKKTGALGEAIVIEYERRWLIENGREDLANNICQISKESVSAGYDIVSYDIKGDKKYIEVKSSKSVNSHFYLTDNELKTAELLSNQYWIYRVQSCSSSNHEIIKIQNPAIMLQSGKLSMVPLSYLVKCP